MKEINVLFVTRNYPPQIGGMEKYSYDLYNSLKDKININILKNSRGRWHLPCFIIRSLFHIAANRKKHTHVHFGDAALSPLAYLTGKISNCKTSITVHALDIIFNNIFYQMIITRSLANLDKIVAVSQFTLDQCLSRGIDKNKCHLIPNGIDYMGLEIPTPSLQSVLGKYGIFIQGKKILFSVGRLIKRKGISWFVEYVMPRLDDDYIYIIAGTGPESKTIADVVKKCGLSERVYLLGNISDADKFCLYINSELYIMPNIKVFGDAEGFGITMIEAAAFGLPAVAADIEGISDVIINKITGILVKERDVTQFIGAIRQADFDRNKIKKLTRDKYDWAVLKTDYIKLIFC